MQRKRPTTGILPNSLLWPATLIAMVCSSVEASAAAPDNPFRQRARRVPIAQSLPVTAALPVTVASLKPLATKPISVRPLAPKPATLRPMSMKAPDPVPLLAVISLADQRITVHNGNGQVAESRVSSGQSGYRTPTGLFSIIQKNKYHESNIYDGAPMPYMQRLTWSGIALHEGNLPGYPASHGCIRLSGGFAQQLWGMTKIGVRVVVSPSRTVPQPLSHANLPVPALTPTEALSEALAKATVAPTAPAAMASLVASSQLPDTAPQALPSNGRALSPLDVARQLRAKAVADAAATATAAKIALDIAAIQSATANAVVARKQRTLAALAVLRNKTATNPAISAANETRIAELERDLEVAAADETAVEPIAFAAAQVARDAERANDAAQAALQDINRRLEPVQVFVSRKAQMVYVRQGFTPIFEAPVTLLDAGASIGTHLYLATGVAGDQTALTWTAITVPETSVVADDGEVALRAARTRRAGETRTASPERVPRLRATAATALDRIEMPDEARKFIAERLWVGASLTISDHGISKETGKGTDFVVLTK